MFTESHTATLECERESVTIIDSRVPRAPYEETAFSVGISQNKDALRWDPPAVRPLQIDVPFSTVPPGVGTFIDSAARVQGVRCVVIEEEEEGIVHITTFAASLSPETRRSIYVIETQTIRDNPNLTFDFHLRRTDEATGPTPVSITGRHFFAVWGSMDADERRPSSNR